MGKKKGNHLPTVAVRWQHMFSMSHSDVPSFLLFSVQYEKKANLYKIWLNRPKTFFLLKVVSFLIQDRSY